MTAWLLAGSRCGFYLLLVLLPVSTRVVIVERHAFNLQPEYLNTMLYAIDIPLAVIIVGWIGANLLNPSRRLSPATWPVSTVLALLVLLAVVSVSWAMVVGVAATLAVRLVLLFLLFLYVQQEAADLRLVTPVLGFASAAHGAVAVGQSVLQRPLGFECLGEMMVGKEWPGASVILVAGEKWLRAYGLSPSPNILGVYLALGVLAWVGWLASKQRYRTWLPFVALTCAGLMVTYSRTAWLGLAVALVSIGLLTWRSGTVAGLRKPLSIVTATLLVVLLLVAGLRPQLFATRLGAAVGAAGDGSPNTESLEELSLSHREAYANAAWQVVARHGLRGVGIGNSPLAASLLSRPPPGERSLQPAHNVGLVLAAELGALGGLLWYGLWAVVALGLWQNRHVLVGSERLILWSAGLGAVGVFSIFDHSFVTYQQSRLMLWVVLGLWSGSVGSRFGWSWPQLPPRERVAGATACGRQCWLGLGAVMAAASGLALAAYVHLLRPRGHLLWDPASFALAGHRMWRSLATQDLAQIQQAIEHAPMYPPGHALILAAVFELFGVGAVQARCVSLVALVTSAALVYWLACELGPPGQARIAGGLLSAALLVTSPTILYLATDAVLEPLAGLLTLATAAALSLYFRSGRVHTLAAVGLLAASVFLVKYNLGLIVIIALWMTILFERHGWRQRARCAGVLALTSLVPAMAWLATDPGRIAGFVAFAVNRSSDLAPLRSALFYPMVFVLDYAALWPVGVLAAAAAMYLVYRCSRSRLVFFAAALISVGLCLGLLHPYKQARFVYTVVPFVMVLAGPGLVRATRDSGVVPASRDVQLATLVAAGIGTLLLLPARLGDYRSGENELLNFDPEAQEVVREMFQTIRDEVEPADGVLVSGMFNEFSEPLLRWLWHVEEDADPIKVYGLPTVGTVSRAGRARVDSPDFGVHLEHQLDAHRPAAVLSIVVFPGSRFYTTDYREWNAWQRGYDEAIASSARLRLTTRVWFDGGGIRLSIYANTDVVGGSATVGDGDVLGGGDVVGGSDVTGPSVAADLALGIDWAPWALAAHSARQVKKERRPYCQPQG